MTLAQLGYGDPPRKQERPQRVLVKTLESLALELLERMEKGIGNPRSTGIELLDEALMGGIEDGDIVLLGGPTSHGKTVLGLQLARNATEHHRNVILVSEEMAGTQLAKRSLQSRIHLPPDEWPAVSHKIKAEAKGYWSNCGKAFVLETCRTIERVEETVKQITSEYDVDMVVLDYVQLLTAKGNSRYEQVTRCSTRFCELVRNHNMAGALVAQFNRDAAKGGADIYSFKDSSQLEQDADIVLLIEWLAKTNPDHPNPRDFRVKIKKNRNRAIRHHEVILEFHPEMQTVVSPEPERYPEFDEWNKQ